MPVIIIGGGLAGLSAAHTVIENGGQTVLLERNLFMGGNSTKATSGINGSPTQAQKDLGGEFASDSAEQFYKDTAAAAASDANGDLNKSKSFRPELVKTLTFESGPAVDWLQQRFKIDLSVVGQMGGHSKKRTHRGTTKFPGMAITYGLMEEYERIAKLGDGRATLVPKARASRLLQEGGSVVGVEYADKKGKVHQVRGAVIIASGGFGADFSPDSLLMKYRPDVAHLPTTNGDHCTGDGIKMAAAAGAGLVDMEHVQVHPTGLVDPADPGEKTKFLAAEALRGAGGILLNAYGERFADELGRRDYVTGQMNNSKGPFLLCLNSASSKEIHWHCEHYAGRGLMKKMTGAELAQRIGVPASKLRQTFNGYNKDAAAGTDRFGKKYFHNVPVSVDDSFHVAQVTPVVHYTMGGIAVNGRSQALDTSGKVIPGLYAAGEAAGGIHGKTRLGGNSLLDCVVYGRVSGRCCVADTGAGGASAGASAPEASAPSGGGGGSSGSDKALTAQEVAKHNTEKDCWVILHDKVWDCTEFLPDHPGGKKAIMLYAGKDATKEFDMLHDKSVLDKYIADSCVGAIATASKL